MTNKNPLEDLFFLNAHKLHQPQEARVPGKLFLVGEYAILEPEQLAVIITVDQYLIGRLTPSPVLSKGSFSTTLEGLAPLFYTRHPQTHEIQAKINPSTTADQIRQWQYVIAAVHTVEAVLEEMGRPLMDYQFEFSTDLVSQEGEKYGLGSSGAVTIATVQALLHFYGLEAKDSLTVFKLTALAMLQTDSRGSLADIAASTYGGIVAYQAPDREWLQEHLNEHFSISSLLLEDWPALQIISLQSFPELAILVGWTGSPASTDNLVKKLQDQIQENDDYYQEFLKRARRIVKQFIDAFQHKNLVRITYHYDEYRELLQDLAVHYDLPIVTPKLQALIDIAKDCHFYGKSSGAGGGDCGIALGQASLPTDNLLAEWKAQGIQPLDVSLAKCTDKSIGGNYV